MAAKSLISVFLISHFSFLISAHAYLPGQIRVDPTTNRWLVYNRDNNLDSQSDPFFLSGAGGPEGFLYGDITPGWTQDGIIDSLIQNGMNGIYMIAVRSHGGDGTSTQNPWLNHTPGTASNSNLDPAIISRWHQWFTRMDSAGIVIYLFFYDDNSDPFYYGCAGCEGRREETMPPEEGAFIKAMVGEFRRYKHLIWVVAEEYQEEFGDGRINGIIQTIRTYDPDSHPIGVHQLPGLTFNFPAVADQHAVQFTSTSLAGCHTDALSAWNNASGRYNLNFAEQFFTDTGKSGLTDADYRQCIWGEAMAGSYSMQLGAWETSSNRKPPSLGMANASRFLVNFFESTDFNAMTPNDSLKNAGTQFVLTNSTRTSLIAYSYSNPAAMGVLGLPAGFYNLKWFNPINGETVTNSITISQTTNTSWPKPPLMGSEVALYIHKSASPTPTLIPGSLISNLIVLDAANAYAWTIQNNLQSGHVQYGDRVYTWATVPSLVSGSQWIRTANLSRTYTSSPLATFSLASPATVYIAFDDRFVKPSWMSGYTDTGQNMVNSEPVTYSLYSSLYSSPQTISLGPIGSGSYGMYSVIVKATSVPGDGNGDGLVDGVDYMIWFTHYRQSVLGSSNGDYNSSGYVDGVDYMIWFTNYGH